ncbi:hypothetical protein Tco_1464289, partial [Tanacetum coccineum]
MTRSTVKRLRKPLDEPKREFQRCRKVALRLHQNESLAIAGRNIFDDEASSSYNTGAKPPTPLKTLHEHSHPNSSGFLNPITFPTKQTGRIVDSHDIWLIQNTCTFQGLRNEDPLRHIRGSHEVDECEQNNPSEQVCLSGGDIYNDPYLMRFYQNDDTSPWGNNKHKEKGEDGLEWIIRIKLKKQKKDDEDERLLSIFKQIHINMPFVEAMIHMPKGAKVLKDLLSHKEKLEKAASLVKLSEECSAIIQRSLPQKEGDLRSFTLPCLIGPLAVKNALADLGASINLMPHSLFQRLGIF